MKLPPFETFPILTSEGIVLRPINSQDIIALVEISYYDGQQARTPEEAAAMQEKIDRDYANGHSIHWGIEDTVTSQLVGTCGYYRGFANSTGELGCVLLAAFRGQGYMTRAMKAAIDFGRQELKLKRIMAVTTKGNSKAIQLLKRLGFEKAADGKDEDMEYVLNSDKQLR